MTGTGTNGCTNTAVQQLTVFALPVMSISPSPATICVGEVVTFTASGAATYSWNNGMSSSAITVSPSSLSTYSVTGMSPEGCTSTAVRQVNVDNCTGLSENETKGRIYLLSKPELRTN